MMWMRERAARPLDAFFTSRRTTIAAAVMLMVAELAFAAIHRSVSGADPLQWLFVAHASIAAAVAAVLSRQSDLAERWSLAGFLALTLPLFPIFWLMQSQALAAAAMWQPFIGRKLIMVALALLTPSRSMTALLLALFMVEWGLIWHHFELADHPHLTVAGEPWVTFVYFGVATSLAVLRWRNRRLRQRLFLAEVDVKTLEHVSRVALGVSDRANTPLQTLEVGLAVLEQRHPGDRLPLERMRRSLEALFVLSRSLSGISRGHVEGVRDHGARLEGTLEKPTSA